MESHNPFRTRPVAMFEGLKGLVLSTMAMLQGFGVVHLSDVQQGLVLAEYVAVTAFVGLYVQSVVTPTVNVALTHKDANLLEAGKAMGS